MKEITITTTTTVKIPTADEIKATARIPSPIEPERALVVRCFGRRKVTLYISAWRKQMNR